MRKIFISILFGLSYISVFSQNYRDTLFVSRNSNDSNFQIIFIDTPHSKFHNLVFQLLLSDSASYYDNLKELAKTHSFKNQSSISKYLGDWISINMYKGRPHAYFPSEPYFNLFIKITDSAIVINDFNEGLVPYLIRKVIQRRRKIVLQLVNSSDTKHNLSLRLKNNRIFEAKSSLLNTRRIKIVKRHTYFELPIIVNYCPYSRCQEFDFK